MGDTGPDALAGDARSVPTGWPSGVQPTRLQIVKCSPDGAPVTEYPGSIVPEAAPPPWLCVQATWTRAPVTLDGLSFVPGDTLLEYFSPTEWFNVFAVHAPDGSLRGWYANVVYPTDFDPTTDPPTLGWRDLYLDVIALPDGRRALRDEDELRDAGIARRDPELYERILTGRAAILQRLDAGAFPFDRP